ncbi:MAG: aldo/keto reductase [Candidatus Omnitrophota bacterium]|nr:MAG: aldo/keto reductase [Candidatus Omnitrophota bacterium]
MEYTEIDGIKVSKICLGTWNITGDSTWGFQDEKDSIETIKYAVDCGINFFDTAEAYGNGYSESLLGKILSPIREKVVIATKTIKANYREVIEACENSLKRLKTDYIDIYYIHWPSRKVPFEETVKAMEKLQKDGKIRMMAVSNFGVKDLSEILKLYPVKLNQLAYSLLFRAIEFEILPFCIKNGVSIACYSPLMEGLLTGKFKSPEEVPDGRARTRHFSKERPLSRHREDGAEEETFKTIEEIRKLCEEINIPMTQISLSYLLHKEGVKVVVVGARKKYQIEENSKACEIRLSDDIIKKLDQITSKLKDKLGKNPDMWLTDSRIR